MPGQQRIAARRSTPASAGRSWSGRAPIAGPIATSDQLKYLRQYSDGPAVRPGHRLLLGRLRRHRHRAHRELRAVRLTTAPLRRPGAAAVRRREIQGGVGHHTLDPHGAEGGLRRAGGHGGRVVAIDPRTGAHPRARSRRRRSTRTCCRAHDPARIRTPTTQSLEADPDKPLLNRPLAMTLPARLDVQARHRRGRAGVGQVHAGHRRARARPPQAARTRAASSNNWSTAPRAARTARSRSPRRSPSRATPPSRRSATSSATTRCATQAEKFGFDDSFEIPLRAATSRFPADPDAPQTAMTAIGQFDVRATALQMAMVGAGIANNGQVMRPYLVAQTPPRPAVLQTPSRPTFARR